MKITRSINELLDSLAEWLGIKPKPVPIPIQDRPAKDSKR
jgi:hypothetical protein